MAGKKLVTRNIFGEIHVSVAKAAELIGCSRSKMDDILKKSANGTLKPALSWYRDTPRSPIWINLASLENWQGKRGAMRS